MNEHLPPLPDSVRAVLTEAAPPAPRQGFEERVFSKIAATLGAPASLGGGASAAGTSAAMKGTLVLGGVVLLGLGVGAGVWLDRTVLAPPPVSSPKPTTVAQPSGSLAVPAAKPELPRPAPPDLAPNAAKAKTARDSRLSAERTLLEVARTALSKGEVAATLAAVAEHERAFPHGRLEEEREVLAIEALAQAGRSSEAKARAQDFCTRFPQSLMRPAVEAVLSQP